MRVTDDGQITLPVKLREKYRLVPGTEVEVIDAGDGVMVVRKMRSDPEDFRDLLKRMCGTANTGLTTDQIMEMTRGED